MKWVELDIDSEDWDEFRTFHHYHGIKFKIVYDCDYEIIVLMLLAYVLRWATYITLGEGLEDDI